MVSSVIRSICMSVIVLKEGVHGQFCHLVCLDVYYCPEREYWQTLGLSFGLYVPVSAVILEDIAGKFCMSAFMMSVVIAL